MRSAASRLVQQNELLELLALADGVRLFIGGLKQSTTLQVASMEDCLMAFSPRGRGDT